MLTTLIGILGGGLLAASGVPQAIKVLKQGHSEGLSLHFMLILNAGILLMGTYIFLEHGWDWVIHGEYMISMGVWSISLWYYFFPRGTKKEVAQSGYWYRDGLMYKSKMGWYRCGQYVGTSIRSLDFVSYHLIRWYHGEEKLKEMANATPKFLKEENINEQPAE